MKVFLREMGELHASIADGKPSEVLAIERFSVDEYYSFLVANNARCERLRKVGKVSGG